LARGQVSADDGKTSYERRKGKPYKRALPGFGEMVMYMTVADGRRRQKAEDRFFSGIFVDIVSRSDEVVIATPEGCSKVNVIRRLPPEQRGDAKFALSIKGVPWEMVPSDESVYQEEVPSFVASEPIVPDGELPDAIPVPHEAAKHRRVYIRREVELRPVAEGGY